jgi:hypothetical protein
VYDGAIPSGIPKVKERRLSITLRKMPDWATKATMDARRRRRDKAKK